MTTRPEDAIMAANAKRAEQAARSMIECMENSNFHRPTLQKILGKFGFANGAAVTLDKLSAITVMLNEAFGFTTGKMFASLPKMETADTPDSIADQINAMAVDFYSKGKNGDGPAKFGETKMDAEFLSELSAKMDRGSR
jgi:hypothetical protein